MLNGKITIENYITASIFDKGWDGYYQRIAINGSGITFNKVDYNNFNDWLGRRKTISEGRVSCEYLYIENNQLLRDLLLVAEACPVDEYLSDQIIFMRLLDICQNTNCLKMIIKLYFAAKFTFLMEI